MGILQSLKFLQLKSHAYHSHLILYYNMWIKNIKNKMNFIRQSKLREELKSYIKPCNSLLYAYKCYKGGVNRLHAINNENIVVNNLSSDIIQSPGYVIIERSVYDLTESGLYRFYKLNTFNEQRIVVKTPFDIFNFIGYLWEYGFLDFLSSELQIERQKLKHGVITAACSDLSRLAAMLLNQVGIETRLVASATLESWNGFDDGHTFLEIKNDFGEWIVYDPSFSVLFYLKEQPTNLINICKYLKHNNVTLHLLPANRGHSHFINQGYDYGFWVDERNINKEALLEWYKHVIQVPIIIGLSKYEFPATFISNSDLKRFLLKNYTPLSDDKFYQLYYP
ncbi:transglutaminase-like domain-containing protein [Candidatus Synechococcus calcipolaris G9]|uniref:Transglutaminase-like domain-containing protein n=1 Tax=Candidatus Synechococcus calcipolaris G9 TaxID=1497997 RepID=A0ABT6EW59_9SYNE|nr:transglutaminase-like domain-containing protein [Candidatus Synechococcus calcipolaris]MDG2989983.1 transglutaminase-like domain-containing protein [Candidatus Synechococcus calcipolaris G9]